MRLSIHILAVAVVALLASVAKSPSQTAADPQATAGQAAVQADAGTNQTAVVQVDPGALVQKLLERVEQLERVGAEKTESIRKAQAEQTEKLLGRIKELEDKVNSLEAGRVLPEIAVAPSDEPTARELDQKIRVLARNHELAAEAAEAQAAARAKEMPRITAGAGGFAISSADTNFVLKLRGLVQLDSRSFINDNPYLEGNDGF